MAPPLFDDNVRATGVPSAPRLHPRRRQSQSPRPWAAAAVEPLEARRLLSAGTIVVNTVADQTDMLGGPTVSLRDAIGMSRRGRTLITFDPAVFPLDRLTTISLTQGPLTMSGGRAVTIRVPGAINSGDAGIAVSGGGRSTVFVVARRARAELRGLTIEQGYGQDAGGIENHGSLTLTDCTVAGNRSMNNGGGVASIGSAASLRLVGCAFTGNVATAPPSETQIVAGGGGGIYNEGRLSVADSAFRENAAGAGGGGIANEAGAFGAMTPDVTVTDCTFTGNAAGAYGGLLADHGRTRVAGCAFQHNSATGAGGAAGTGNAGELIATDDTLSDNTAGIAGGLENRGRASLLRCTFSRNTGTYFESGGLLNEGTLLADACAFYENTLVRGILPGAAGVYASAADRTTLVNCTVTDNAGTGIGIGAAAGKLLVVDCTVTGNSDAGLSVDSGNEVEVRLFGCLIAENPTDVRAPWLQLSGGYNLVGDGSGGLSTANHNLLGLPTALLDPFLAPLGEYGGPTVTVALAPASPAVGAGHRFTVPGLGTVVTDQRGVARPITTDIGAFQSGGSV